MSEKPTFNYFGADGSLISFRQSLAEFAPSPEEIERLRGQVAEVLGQETTPQFDDTISYLITLLRNKAYMHSASTSITAVQKELSNLEKQLNGLRTYLESGLSEATHNQLTPMIVRWMGDKSTPDPLYGLYANAGDVLEICETVRTRIKGKRPEFPPNEMRQIVAEEVARELDAMGVEPTKYRDGAYAKIVRFVLETIPCTVNDTRISISIPSDLFSVLSDAIDVYKTKSRYALLNFD